MLTSASGSVVQCFVVGILEHVLQLDRSVQIHQQVMLARSSAFSFLRVISLVRARAAKRRHRVSRARKRSCTRDLHMTSVTIVVTWF